MSKINVERMRRYAHRYRQCDQQCRSMYVNFEGPSPVPAFRCLRLRRHLGPHENPLHEKTWW